MTKEQEDELLDDPQPSLGYATIEFEAIPATAGWRVYAVIGGEKFLVGRGLILPEPTLDWCRKNIETVRAEIQRVKSK